MLVLGVNSVYSQSYFSEITIRDTVAGLYNGVIQKNEYYYTCGNELTQNNEVFLNLTKFDSLGNEIWTVWRGDSNTVKWKRSGQILADDSSIYLFGVVYDSSGPNRDICIYKFDFNGNELEYKRFGDPLKEEATRHVERTSDGGFICVGEAREINSNSVAPYVVKLDKNLSIEWEQRYGLNGVDDWGGGVAECSDGGYLVAGRRWDAVNNSAKKWVFKVDSNGVFLWDTLWGNINNTYSIPRFKTIDNRYHIYTTGYFISQYSYRIELYCFDNYGEVVWSKSHIIPKGTYLQGIIINEDKTITFNGQTYNSNNKQQPFILKITPRGDTIFTRNYTENPNQHSYAWDMTPSSFGGYVFVGSTVTNSQDAWIKKIDCMGCDSIQCYFPDSCHVYDCNTDYPPIADFTLAEDTIWFVDSTTIKFSNSSSDCAGYTWFINGDSFNLVNPNYTFTQTGDYEIILVGRNVTCTDTARATLHLINTVGIKENLNGSGFSVYPNPFDNSFRVVISNPKVLMQSGRQVRNPPSIRPKNIILYNMLGEKVDFSLTLEMTKEGGNGLRQVQSDIRIDASNIPNGIYFIEIEGVGRTKIIKQ